ncbi:MAG: DUF3419 family protein [Alphaproteobacteria bacterium]|nr:DUF3419 family protein [Alphaproteobacteria bacterium]
MAVRDRAFQRVFASTFVYNLLFEDAEVDERHLGVDEDSTVLGISGAGCGLAGMVSRRPRSIDAVDINPHHLALAALKVEAARRVQTYDTFYDLLGRGWSPEPERVVRDVVQGLPRAHQRYWRTHHVRFRRSLYHTGLTAKMLAAVRQRAGLSADWVREVSPLPEADRVRAVEDKLQPLRASLPARCVLQSPLQLLALGINFAQRDTLVDTERQQMVDYFVTHLSRLARTHVPTNWFAWFGAAGQFNHAEPDGVPPYLRRTRWETSVGAPTRLGLHNRNLFDVLGEAGPRTWSHYTLCDAVDWMPPEVQRRLFEEIRRTARDGAVVLFRSVGEVDLVAQAGMSRWFERLPGTEGAAAEDRSCQYRQVAFFRVTA